MKRIQPLYRFAPVLAQIALLALLAFTGHAQTFWTGKSISYTETNSEDADVILADGSGTPIVSFARDFSGLPYNPAAGESFSDFSESPADTEWAFGTIDQVMADPNSLTFITFPNFKFMANDLGEHLSQFLPNAGPMVLHLINENIYISLTFTSWAQGFHTTDGFSYVRSTSDTVTLPPAPTVSILTPANNSTVTAPAAIVLTASATQTGGTVTNMQYFAATASATNSLGSATTSPFSVTNTFSAPGTYSLTAVATGTGASGTSAPISLTVVAPTPLKLSSPHRTGTNFIFNYSATPGSNYVVQAATNVNGPWLPVLTNVAAGGTVTVTNGFNTNAPRTFYRVHRL